MKLRDLKENLVKAYGDFTLESAFEDIDNFEGDTLALYIARELDCAIGKNTVISKEHLIEYASYLATAKEDLCRCIEELEKLIQKEPE